MILIRHRARYALAALLWAVAALYCGVLLGTTTGCMTSQVAASKDPEAIAYASLHDAWATVDAYMVVYGVRVRAGQVSAERQASIDAAHEQFRQAVLVGIAAAQLDWQTAPPEEIAAMAATLIALIQQL
jgi:hypothetical protein